MMFADWSDVAAHTLTLPGTKPSTSYGQPAIEVRARAFVSSGHVEGSLHVLCPHEEKPLLVETDRDTFWQTPHYEGWPGLLVRYGSPDRGRIARVIARAWWDRAPAALRKTYGDRP